MKKLLLTLVVVLMAQLGMAQASDAFKKDVVKYLELSGQRKTIEMVTKDIVSNIPAEKQADFKKELDASITNFMNKLAEPYMAEFTHEDIKTAIKFYETPVGKKLTEKAGVLYEKGQAVGQEWGMEVQGLMMKYMQ